MKRDDFDCMPQDSTDRNGLTMYARDLIQSPDALQRPRTKKMYTFPQLQTGIWSFLSVLNLEYKTRKGEKYAVCISFFELYQDRIYDLLDDSQSIIQKRKHLPLKRDVTSGRRFVSGLRKIYAGTAEVSSMNQPHILNSNLIVGSILDSQSRTKFSPKQRN